jgi:hypothetical protein
LSRTTCEKAVFTSVADTSSAMEISRDQST